MPCFLPLLFTHPFNTIVGLFHIILETRDAGEEAAFADVGCVLLLEEVGENESEGRFKIVLGEFETELSSLRARQQDAHSVLGFMNQSYPLPSELAKKEKEKKIKKNIRKQR